MLRRLRVANLLTSSKLQPGLLKQPLKAQKELEIMYYNAIYMCVS